MLVRTSTLANKATTIPYLWVKSFFVKPGVSAALGNVLNMKSYKESGSGFLISREARGEANSLMTFSWGVGTSIFAVLDASVYTGGMYDRGEPGLLCGCYVCIHFRKSSFIP